MALAVVVVAYVGIRLQQARKIKLACQYELLLKNCRQPLHHTDLLCFGTSGLRKTSEAKQVVGNLPK